MSEPHLKSNVLPFPVQRMLPDPPRPSLLRGAVALVVILVAASLICLTAWALITL